MRGPSWKLPSVSRQAHVERKNHDGQYREFEPHGMGVQIPCGVHPEREAQGAVRATAQAPWKGVPSVGDPEGMPN